jgi:hypothetical protein
MCRTTNFLSSTLSQHPAPFAGRSQVFGVSGELVSKIVREEDILKVQLKYPVEWVMDL